MRKRAQVLRTVLLVGFAVTPLFMVDCGGPSKNTTPAGPNTYVYAAMGGNNTASLAQFQMSSSGTLMALTPAVVATNFGISTPPGAQLAADSSGRHLFLAGDGAIGQFVVGSDGALSPNAIPYADGPIWATSVALTGAGLAVATNGAVLESYSLTSTGTLTPLKTAPVTNANSLVLSPSGKFLYIDDEAYNFIAVYAIATDGAFTFNGTVASEMYPWSLVFSPGGMLYSADYGAGTITEYSVDGSTGIPTKIESFSTGSEAGTSAPLSMVFSITGEYAYVINGAESTVSQFLVDTTTGALRRNGPDIGTCFGPGPITLDPSGKFVFVGCGGAISQFSINSNGTLDSNGVVTGLTNPEENTTGYVYDFGFAQR
jgi:6-phosphogluconolactonase